VSGVVACAVLDVDAADGVSLSAHAASAIEHAPAKMARRTKHESVCMLQA
jgi:hypothetical protein